MARQTTKIKIDRRKLRQPDEFISWTTRTWTYVQTNWKMVASVAGAIILIVILAAAYRVYRQQQEARAAVLVSEAISSFAKDISQTEALDRILQDFPGTKSAKLARLYLGHAQYRKGDTEKAATTYGVLARDASVQEPVRSLAILSQGYALVTLRRCQEAETTFGLLGSASPLAQQEAFLAIGRCFELKGDLKAAFKRYEDFASRFPSSPLLSEPLKEKIQSMKGTNE
jgi:hypothetical protein